MPYLHSMLRPFAILIACTCLVAAADTILVGQPCPLEGPAKGLGLGMNLGLRAAIAETPQMHGRAIELVAVDDGYDPDKCVDATAGLIEERKVFCLAGLVGTPTSKAALPVAIEAQVPVVGLFTGAMALRQPPNPLVFHVRASYDDETELLVERLTTDVGAKRIAVFHQNDAFGQAGLSGTKKALEKRGMAVAGIGIFERNTVAVQAGLATVQESAPDAVIMVGPYKPVAAFVKEARAKGLSCPLATISFVGTENLIAETAAQSEGLIISQVVPSPSDPALPVAVAYRTALAKVDAAAKPSYVSFEGYITGRVLLAGLDKAGPGATRATLVSGLAGLQSHDLGGLTISYGAERRVALDRVWLTRVAGGAAVGITSLK